MPLDLPYQVLEDLLCDPRFASEALLGVELDDFQSARLKLNWWFPYTIDSSGTMSGKTVGMYAHAALRGILLEDQVVACYMPTGAAGMAEFTPYFRASLEKAPANWHSRLLLRMSPRLSRTRRSSSMTATNGPA